MLAGMRKATVVLIAALALTVGGGPEAQPVPVGSLPAPGFQSADFQPVFDYANNATSTAEWEAMIGHGRFLLATSWEAQVDAQIDARVAAVGASDHFNSVAEYRAYLRNELLLQKNAAFTSWEQAADAEIETQRDAFVAALGAAGIDADARDDASQLQSAQSGDRSVQEFTDLFSHREEQHQQALNSGLQQYQTSFDTLQQDYANFLNELDQSEAAFAQNFQQIESYKAVVRNGIQQSINGLEQNLATNQLFYEESCDANDVCSTDPSTLNPAGLQLQSLIAGIRADLAADAPLSTLTQTMTDYLEARQTETVARVTTWTNRSTGNQVWRPASHVELEKQCVERNSLGLCTKEEDPLDSWKIQAVRTFLDTGDDSQLRAELQKLLPKTIQTIHRNGTNLRGDSSAGFRTPLEINAAGHGENYTDVGDKAFEYDTGIVCGLQCLAWLPTREEYVEVSVNYTWFDSNADHNRTVWQGYADDLAPMLLEWQNEILPAIETWENQTAAYESNYAAWQAQATMKRAGAAAAYRASVNELDSNRTRWISRLQSQYRDQSAQWRSIQAQLEARAAAGELQAGGLVENLDAESESTLRAIFNAPTPAVHLVARNNGEAFQNDANFLGRGAAFQPKTDILKRTLGAFQKSSLGAKNLATARAYDDLADKRRQQALERMQSVVDAQNGFVHQMRNLPQSVIDIDQQLGDQNSRLRELQAADEPNAAAIVDLRAKIQDLQYKRAQALADDLVNHTDASFQTHYDADGNLIMQRDIASGEARLRAGGDAENVDDYGSVDVRQRISIAPPDVMQIASGGDLFASWDAGNIDAAFRQNAIAYDQQVQSHIEYAANVMNDANSFAMDREAAFDDHAEHLVEEAQKPKKLAEQIFRSMFGGMDFGAAFQSVMQGELRKQLAPAFAKALNIPAELAASLLGGAFSGDLNIGETIESYVNSEIRGNIMSTFAKATGWPSGFVSGLMGDGGFDFSEENMRAAAQSYAEDQILDHIETHTGIEGLAGMLRSTVVADFKKNREKKAAAKLKPEDYATGGLSYTWRNAQYNQNLAAGVQVAEIVATSAASSTGFGVAAVAGYYAAKSAYSSHLSGESTDSVLKNALAGGASSVINNYTSKFGVNVNLAYSEDQGFGGNLSASIPLGGANSPLKIGASLSFQDGQGVTGGGLTAGFSRDGKGIKAGINFDEAGKVAGGSISANYTQKQGFGASAGVNFGARGEFAGVNAEVTYTDTRQYGKVGQTGKHTAGLGLTYYADGSRAMKMINRTSAKDEYGIGVNSASAGNSLTFRYDKDGKYLGHGETIDLDAGFQTQADKEKAMRTRLAQLNAALKDDRLSPEQRRELKAERTQLGERQSREDRSIAAARYRDRLLAEGKITRKQHAELKKDPEKFHSGKYARLQSSGDAAKSRVTVLAKISGAIGDAAKWIVGDYSDSDGYLDPETGQYVARTCFVAGTLVRVHPKANGAFSKQNGNWYKQIEEIRAGDLVLSWNEESGKTSFNPVAQTFVRETPTIYRLSYANGMTIETTWSHPFYIQDRGWVEAKDLAAGDISFTAASQSDASGRLQLDPKGLRITSVESLRTPESVFNFTVETDHTYFVGASDVLVHNRNYLDMFEDSKKGLSLLKATNSGVMGATELARASNKCANLDVEENYQCTKKYFDKATKHFSKMGTEAAKTSGPAPGSVGATVLVDTVKDTAEDVILGENSVEATATHGIKHFINSLLGKQTAKYLMPGSAAVVDKVVDETTGAIESKVLSSSQKRREQAQYSAARRLLDPIVKKPEQEHSERKALEVLLKNMEREARAEQQEFKLLKDLLNLN
ncbi:MAG: TIGR04388 family protein [bacterium]|nr:TIGR04388 family protein [bacterium]